MPLTLCRDLSAADWISASHLPWDRLVSFGPAGFDSYARLRLMPDPQHPGQSENDAEPDGRPDQLPLLLEALAARTPDPDDCYFCVWEGFATVPKSFDAEFSLQEQDSPTMAAEGGAYAPLPSPGRFAAMPGHDGKAGPPKVEVPNRAYWLFHGSLTDVGAWDSAAGWPDSHRLHSAEPAFVWPADRSWCVALDVDPHWAGIGAGADTIAALLADPRLDVVPADPDEEQPAYT